MNGARGAAIALLVGWSSGCVDARTDADAGAPDAAMADGGAEDAGSVDAGPRTCAESLMERRVALDPDGPLTQIHPSVLFDGEGIWVTYVRPEPGGGNFDVWATRRACDGTVLVAPFLVQADPTGNDIDPAIAQSGDTLLIAWVTDDGTGGTANLQVRFRSFTIEGEPRDSVDHTLRTSRMGAPIVDNHNGAELAVAPDGTFLVAGARAVPEVMRFAAYAQVVGLDGALVGDALEPAPEPMITNSSVAVDVSSDGARWLVYDREPDAGGAAQVMLSDLDGAAPELVVEGLVSSGGADVLAVDGAVYVAMSGEADSQIDLRIVDVIAPLSDRVMRTIGAPGRVDHSPRLAAGGGAVAVAFYRQIRGFSNDLYVASISDPSLAPVLVDSPVPSYQPALTHVMNDYWFLSYAIGDSPDFRLVGRFVQLR
ncbi:MAG: hypothetical protein H6719_21035 [Sandaracinaceae bacterium]|nr:hypothetical protein [Sandaracinaceae bacterium]